MGKIEDMAGEPLEPGQSPEDTLIKLEQQLAEARRKIIELQTANAKKDRQIEILTPLVRKDHLTGLDNRRAFDEEIHRAVRDALRTNQPLSLILMDFDNFGKINTNHRYEGGNIVLATTAGIMEHLVRETDRVARYGGEEFAVILPHTSQNHALGVAERMRKSIGSLDIKDEKDTQIPVTVTIGVGSYIPKDPEGIITSDKILKSLIAQLFNNANDALLRAKKVGKNRTGFLTEAGQLATLEPSPQNHSKMVVVLHQATPHLST